MGVFNNFINYDAKAEAARRKSIIEEFLASDEIHLLMTDEKPTVKIEKCSGAGSSYSVICPSCGKIKFLSNELNTMSAICNKCHCVFNLER